MKKPTASRNLNKLTDEELIERYRGGDMASAELILERYKPLVKTKARLYYLEGGDHEDLLQEGMLGLYKALRSYDEQREAAFSTFASLLVSRQMISAIETAGRQKNRLLNEAASLDAIEDERASDLGTAPDPETIYMDKEAVEEIAMAIDKRLSPMERDVLRLYLDGKDYRRIAKKLNKSEKSIDNALQRIRAKLRKIK